MKTVEIRDPPDLRYWYVGVDDFGKIDRAIGEEVQAMIGHTLEWAEGFAAAKSWTIRVIAQA